MTDIAKITRAELNKMEPEDHASEEWKQWNGLRVAINDRDTLKMQADISRLHDTFDEFMENVVTRRQHMDNELGAFRAELAEQKRLNTIAFEKILEAIDHVAKNHIHTVEELARDILAKMEKWK